jgi:Domain of unknown function (DUF5658)
VDGNELVLERRDTDRRVNRRNLYYPERRTGFDRRSPSLLTTALRDRPVALITVLVLVNVLSIADWMLTLRVLEAGAAEGNPVLAAMISANPAGAFVFKLAATLGVTIALWSWRRYRAVLATAIGALLIYAGLMVYHAWGLSQLGLL